MIQSLSSNNRNWKWIKRAQQRVQMSWIWLSHWLLNIICPCASLRVNISHNFCTVNKFTNPLWLISLINSKKIDKISLTFYWFPTFNCLFVQYLACYHNKVINPIPTNTAGSAEKRNETCSSGNSKTQPKLRPICSKKTLRQKIIVWEIYKQTSKFTQHFFHCFFSGFYSQCNAPTENNNKIGQIAEEASIESEIHIMHCRHLVSRFTELHCYECSLDGQFWHAEVRINSVWKVERKSHSTCYRKSNQS